MEGNPQLLFYLLFIPNMLLALSIHEASHAGSAYLLGDDTAARAGRVTLNPIPHIDPFGLLAFFIVHFGWAKPVPVNPLNFKEPRRDNMLVSLAGPASNLILALVLLLAIRVILWQSGPTASEGVKTALAILFIGAQLNVVLCIFNLLPIPPLDGSHILLGLLPESVSRKLEPYMAYGPTIFIILIVAVIFLGLPIFRILIFTPMQYFLALVLGLDNFRLMHITLQNFLLGT